MTHKPRKRPLGDPLRAVGYLRVSRDEQGNGIDAQRDAILAWSARDGATVVAWHQDIGVSGATPPTERPGFLAALVDLEQLHAGLLLVGKRDRLARDVGLAAVMEGLARAQGARIMSAAGEGTTGEEPADVLQRRIVDVFAEFERATIRARTRAALAARRRRGDRYCLYAPLGYRWDGAKLAPDETERALIARVQHLHAHHCMSAREIAEALNDEGLKNRRGGPHTVRTVYHMIVWKEPTP
jgi:DNA invertase Pin-like site-specific DNA recombinase